MAELRSVDPRTLKPNPNNPRRTPVPLAMDEQLVASIKAIGIIQPPVVREADGELIVKAGGRRVKAAIAAQLPTIDVLVKNDGDDTTVPMVSLSENLIRASMTSVDIWRGVEDLEKRGWNEQAIADALNLPVRTIKRLKLLAHIHPPMLDVMAQGSMPTEEQLRTIAAASLEEQTQVWKKNKPKKGHDVYWHEIARALSKRRIPFSAARFDDDLARAYGVVWEDDLFVPAGEDGRYTTNVEGFFGAQQEWLANNLPERGSLLAQDEYGRPVLPKKAEQVYGKPGKTDQIGHYLDPHSGEVKTIAYRMPPDKSAAKPGKSRGATESGTPQPKSRPDVTQKGNAIIGDLRTDALHQALRERDIDDGTLLALLVLALGGKNVSIQSAAEGGRTGREAACQRTDRGRGAHDRPGRGAQGRPRDVAGCAVVPRQHDEQRHRRARRRRCDRCEALPAEHGDRGVPLLSLEGRSREGGRSRRRQDRVARQGHPRQPDRAVQGRHLRAPERPVRTHRGRDRRGPPPRQLLG